MAITYTSRLPFKALREMTGHDLGLTIRGVGDFPHCLKIIYPDHEPVTYTTGRPQMAPDGNTIAGWHYLGFNHESVLLRVSA